MSDSTVHAPSRLGRWADAFRGRMAGASDLGQTALVAVLTLSLVVSIVAVALVQTVVTSLPLQQTKAVQLYANRALEAGQNAYMVAINANSSLAQCSTNTNGDGVCAGLTYGQWDYVDNSTDNGGDAEYYAFGNPVPTFDPTSHTLVSLSVQIVGAARDASAPNGYVFDQNTITVTPNNGFLQNVWWTNYESYSPTGSYTTCNYNWNLSYNIDNKNLDCAPVYFGPQDYLFGPVYTNDSVFVSGNGQTANSPAFGTPSSPSAVTTADPHCLFVDDTYGMSGSDTNCANANNEVALYDTTNSSSGNPVEVPPTDDSQLGLVASLNGCLYSGPTQITLSGSQMTVVSPDTPVTTSNGTTTDTNNVAANANNCPINGTASLPANGVVYVENASSAQAWANPFDDPIANSVTNLTESGTMSSGHSVTLTATVTSDSNQLNSGATVSFSQTTSGRGGGSSTINGCSSQTLSTPTTVAPYTATATCTLTYSSQNTGAFSATYSGGSYATTSSASLGQTYTLTPSYSYGPYAQTTAGGCTSCYYGETSSPDAEGDAFVNGSLSGELTIGTANDVIVDGNITYADCNWTTGQSGQANSYCPYNAAGTNDTLGLIADNYIEVNQPIVASTSTSNNSTLAPNCTTPAATCNPTPGTSGLTIDAAVLALTESFVVNNYDNGTPQGPLNIYGSIQQYARGPVGTFSGNSIVSGYQKAYTWDPLLDYLSPPSYLAPSTAAWTLAAVSNNAGTGATSDSVCPPLEPPYGYTQWITAYCSQSTNGLPNYPSSTVPTPPTWTSPNQPNLGATANADGTVSLSWYAPVSSNGSSITGYTVTPNPACSTCGGTSVSGTSTTISGLTDGQTYTFTVTATNASGVSSPSTASNWIQVPNVPNAPTLAAAVANSNGSVSVSWADPSNGGSPITGYTVSPSPSCSSCSGTSVFGPTATSTTITGLTGGSNYTFTVTATNAVGTSASSPPSNSVTVPTVPGAPTIGTATSGNTTATVSWTAPASNGGSAITAYVVTPYLNGTTAQTARTFTSTNTTQTVTGLTNGSAYTFTVAAINTIGTGSPSAASNSVTPATLPGTPTIGTATGGNASATVTWTAPASTGGDPITAYVVTPYLNGTTAQTAQSFSSTNTSETVTGLTNGSAYSFTVAAVTAVGTGTASAKSNSVTPSTTPSAPTIGTVTGGNTTATVTWTAPSSNGGANITGYVVTPYIGGAAQIAQQFNTTATSDTVSGLTNGTTYTFTVAAINADGVGAQSAASSPVIPATTPGAPTIGTATRGNASATVTWTAPASNGGSSITGYVVTPYLNGTTAQTAQTFNSTATSETVSGLTNGSAYTFTVAAINSVGTGGASAQSNSVTPATTPGAPTIGAVTGGNASATVSWTAPASTGGAAITAYVVTPYVGGAAQIAQQFNSTATTQTVTGLTNGTAYTFTVAAINSVGTGTQSGSSSSVTPATTPGAPTIGTATAGNASATVTWTAPTSNGGAAITGYVVTPYLGGTAQTATTFNSTATTETVTGLSNSTYTFTVAAINSAGTGSASAQSNSVTPTTAPGAPTIGTATPGNTTATVTWTAPSSNGGSAITGYVVTPYVGGTAQTATTFNSTATTQTMTGLTNGTAYTFTVAAINGVGTGTASAQSNSVTPATLPGAPTIGTATRGNASATVTWTAPASNGGATITSYVVTPYIGGTAQTATTFNSTATTETVSGLTNGTAYTFTVAAINSVGTGTASVQSNSVTPATTAGAPTIGTATGGNASATVTWTAPASTGGAAITGYVVTPYVGSTAQTATTFNSTATTETVTGLTNGTTYTFTVAAINSVGTGTASAQSNSVTPATTPGAPTIGTATSGNASATVTWTAPASTGGAAITGYVVTPYIGGTAQTAQTFNSTATSENATGLTNGTAYTFTVAAINSVGTGAASGQSNSVTPATTPGIPTIGTATPGNASATVTWTAPASTGGSTITGYVVTPYIGATAQTAQTFNSAATSEVATGLTNGTAYTFTVAAINAVGTGTASGASNSVTPATTPGVPTIGTATSGNASATVTWTAPSSNGGSTITGYVVTPYIGATAQTAQTFNSAATSETVTGLTNGTAYTFKVAAINGIGTGTASGASNSVTPATTPGAPTIGTATVGVASATVTWTAPASNGGATITGYVVTPYIGATAQTAQTFNSTATTETVTGLANNTAYTFKVAAINSVGTGTQSGASNSVTTPTTPGAPTIGTATTGNSQATVTWTAPASNGGSAITGYVVTPYIGGTAQTAQTFNSTATSEVVTGLTNTAYTFKVAAINGVGTGTQSSASNSVTPLTPPGAPTIGTASKVSNTSASVTWTAPATNGGSAVTGYVVTPYIGGTAQTATTFNTTATTETVTGLTHGNTYTFKVAAINAEGTGTQSGASNSVPV